MSKEIGSDSVVTINRPAVDMTAQEIADRDRANDENKIKSATLKTAHVLVELVTILRAKNVIAGVDFNVATEQMYQDVKAIADRLKAP